jgi:hypothetical protein
LRSAPLSGIFTFPTLLKYLNLRVTFKVFLSLIHE